METRPSEIVVKNGRVYHLGLAKGELAGNIFFVGDPARAHLVASRFDSIEHEVRNREFVTLTGPYRNIPMSVMGTGIGTDNVEIALVEAYNIREFDLETGLRDAALPPMNIIRIGTSGGVQKDIEPGTLGITTYALGIDSTGLYYDHPAVDTVIPEIEEKALDVLNRHTPDGSRFKGKIFPYASRGTPEITDLLVKHAESFGHDYVKGITVSSPGFYGPSGRFIDGLKNTVPGIKHHLAEVKAAGHRVINMEMESSLIFHIAENIGCRAGTICPIISSPGKSDKVADYNRCIQDTIDIALETMLELAQ